MRYPKPSRHPLEFGCGRQAALCYRDTVMRVRSGSLFSFAVVVLWLIVGPWVMAFGPCAAMGMECGGPCAAPSSPTPRLQTAALMPLVAIVAERSVPDPAAPSLTVPQPPPKSRFVLPA